MGATRARLLELYSDPDIDEPFPEQPVTPRGIRHAASLERAAWCLATAQPWDTWLALTVDERAAFLDAVLQRAQARH